MTTLAAIKRRVVPGTRMLVVGQTYRPELVGTHRTVVQNGSSVWTWTDDDRGGAKCRTEWPKAADFRSIGADTFEFDMRRGGEVVGTVALRLLDRCPSCGALCRPGDVVAHTSGCTA